MRHEILDRAADLLAGLDADDLAVDRLRDLVEPTLAAATLLRWLSEDPRFMVTRAPDPLDGIPLAADDLTRARYRAALGAADAAPRVRLRDLARGARLRTPNTDAMRLLASSIRRLLVADEPTLTHRIAEARAEYGALARSARPGYPEGGR